jgi:hypothetical protein
MTQLFTEEKDAQTAIVEMTVTIDTTVRNLTRSRI